MLTRRSLLLTGASAFARAAKVSAISLNEDPNHFFASRAPKRITREDLLAWVDQYAGTQVRELILCVNAQRTAFASKVWTPFWKDYDPDGPDEQPLFASTPAPQRKFARQWIHTAWQMHRDGLDHFAIWIDRAKEKGLSPWLSMRMNDLHNVDDEQHYLHSDFWRKHPEFRRVPYRTEMRDKALDYGRAEVRDYAFALLDEIAHRYDFEGLELDWMRHGFHFAPGREDEGREHLNEFMTRVRKRMGRKVKIGVRVPSHPETALRLGFDPVEWARSGSVDMVVPTNYWRTTDTGTPITLWRQLLPERCLLGGGLELGLNPHVGSLSFEGKPFSYNTLETVRGVAATFLEQGADRTYLFNYMDSQTAIEELSDYPHLLRQAGSLRTVQGKPRRHILTYADTWAPGEPSWSALPARLQPEAWRSFRLGVGPPDPALKPIARTGASADLSKSDVRVNGVPAEYSGVDRPVRPWPNCPVHRFRVSNAAMRAGDAVIDLRSPSAAVVEWIEIAWI